MLLLSKFSNCAFVFVGVVSDKSVLVKSSSMLDDRDENSCVCSIPLVIIDSKVVSATFLLICFVCLKGSISEARKSVFYFTLKARFVIEIIKF